MEPNRINEIAEEIAATLPPDERRRIEDDLSALGDDAGKAELELNNSMLGFRNSEGPIRELVSECDMAVLAQARAILDRVSSEVGSIFTAIGGIDKRSGL